MKTTIATIIALGLAGLSFAQTTPPTTPAPTDTKMPSTTKVKKHKKAVKKADKAAVKADKAAAKAAATTTTTPAPVKK